MGVSPCIAWCAADARPSPRHTSPWSCRSATGAQRLVSAGTLVRVLAPPVKAGIRQGRSAQQYPPRRCGAADYISSIAKPVVSWDHHNLLISTIHEGVTVLGEVSLGEVGWSFRPAVWQDCARLPIALAQELPYRLIHQDGMRAHGV